MARAEANVKEEPIDAKPWEAVGVYERLRRKLGTQSLRSDRDLAKLVEERLPLTSVESLSSSGLSDDEIYTYIVPRRTLVHRKSKKERLTQDESDRAVRIARITSLAEEVFGNDAKAGRWLRKPKERFEGRTPLETMRTEAGARLVEEMLLQLDYGFFCMNQSVILWRISNYASLDGLGGMYAAGRWHSRGHPVLYCSEDPSTALLETLVHLEIDAEDRPERFQVLKIESSEPVSIEQADFSEKDNWFEDIVWTRQAGDAWLSSARTLLLQVPSVLVPERRNYVVNPLHPDIKKLSISSRYSHPFDPRFFR